MFRACFGEKGPCGSADKIFFVGGCGKASAAYFDSIVERNPKVKPVTKADGHHDGNQFMIPVRSAARDFQSHI